MKTPKSGFTLIELMIGIAVFTALTTLASYFKSHYQLSAEMGTFQDSSTPIRSQVHQLHQMGKELNSQFCKDILDGYGEKLASPKYPTIAVECSNQSFLIQKWSDPKDYSKMMEIAGYFKENNQIQWICHAASTINHSTLGQCQDWNRVSESLNTTELNDGLKCNCFESKTFDF